MVPEWRLREATITSRELTKGRAGSTIRIVRKGISSTDRAQYLHDSYALIVSTASNGVLDDDGGDRTEPDDQNGGNQASDPSLFICPKAPGLAYQHILLRRMIIVVICQTPLK